MAQEERIFDQDFEVEICGEDVWLRKYTGQEAHVVVPEGITHLKPGAFSGNDGIISIILPQSIINTHKGEWRYTFEGCAKLECVDFPDWVKGFYGFPFKNCPAARRFELPSGIQHLRENAFSAYADSLEQLTVSPENTHFHTERGILYGPPFLEKSVFNMQQNAHSVYYCDKKTEGTCRVADSTICVRKRAFANCKKIVTFISGDNRVEIGSYAFWGCDSLQVIIIPNAAGQPHEWFEKEKFIPIVSNISLKEADGSNYTFVSYEPQKSAMKSRQCLVLGYMRHPEMHTKKMDSRNKHAYAVRWQHKLLPIIFGLDDPQILRFYGDNNMITDENFERTYLMPAQTAGAKNCIEYLQKWKWERMLSE